MPLHFCFSVTYCSPLWSSKGWICSSHRELAWNRCSKAKGRNIDGWQHILTWSLSVNPLNQLASLSPWLRHSVKQTGEQQNRQRDTLCRGAQAVSQACQIVSARGKGMLKPKPWSHQQIRTYEDICEWDLNFLFGSNLSSTVQQDSSEDRQKLPNKLCGILQDYIIVLVK